MQPSHLSHNHILTLLNELSFSFDYSLEELYVLDIPSMGFNAVHKVLNHPLINLTAKLEVIHEDMLHCHCLQDLSKKREIIISSTSTIINIITSDSMI